VDNLEDWYAEVLENDETTAEELEAFARLADADAEFAEMLAMDYVGIATMLAEHEHTTVATLAYLLEVISVDWNEAAYVLQAIADNPRSTTEILNTLFLHGDMYVREMVVGHSNVSNETLIRAAQDKRERVRARLTYDNAKVPNEALRYLAENDPEDYIRSSAEEELKRRKKMTKTAR
jgi:glutaredoxin-related protein